MCRASRTAQHGRQTLPPRFTRLEAARKDHRTPPQPLGAFFTASKTDWLLRIWHLETLVRASPIRCGCHAEGPRGAGFPAAVAIARTLRIALHRAFVAELPT